ncbi:MFS transporter [Actinokineospora enzanensis]|uniref:MFS transporter n=1 Tax=Actinokineospora enzanensis TaxID=155975 RepID=UPI0003609996|nr:MFS transporter [Actinokineospora enzanensis]
MTETLVQEARSRRFRLPMEPGSPARRLVAVSLVDSLGTGLFFAGSVLFLTRSVGLTAGQVSLGLALVGLVGFLSSVPVSSLGDRIGPLRLLIVLQFWRFVGFCGYALVHTFPQYLIVALFIALGDRVSNPVLQATVGLAVGESERVTTMAWVRSTRNVGYTLGAALASGAVAIGTEWSYRGIVLGDGLSFLLAGFLLCRVRLSPAGSETGAAAVPKRRFRYLRDRRYLALTAFNGFLALHLSMLTVGIPLWLSQRTDLPGPWVPALVFVNTILAVLFQAAVARRLGSLRRAGIACLGAAVALAATCGVYAITASTAGVLTITLAITGIVALTTGELLQSAGAWEISYDLAPPEQRGVYLGVFSLGVVGAEILGPSLYGGVVLPLGPLGWAILAALFLIAGAGVFALCRRELDRPTAD